MKRTVGEISDRIQSLLNLDITGDTSIYLGETNIAHMEKTHPADYAKHKNNIEDILKSPDYVCQNKNDGSLEYVKEYQVDNEYVKIAIRITTNNQFYVRSIYKLNNSRVANFISKGTLKKV